jgi:hypothetical protein
MRTLSTTFPTRPWRALGLAALAACALAPEAAAQYSLTWYTIDGGGRSVTSGGSYSLGSTIGQPDAGRALSGGSYTLTGGFWFRGTTLVAVEDEGEPAPELPATFHLYAPAPNPSAHRTTIAFDMPSERVVRLLVHDAAGRRVRTLVDGRVPAGRHRLTWDGADDAGRPAAIGIYFVRFEAGTAHARHKIALIR